MTFTSFAFLVFFIVITLGFYVIPRNWRWILLLVGSAYFYMAFVPKYILILLALILIDYTTGLLIERSTGNRKRIYFLISIISNIGILFVFKYFNFFNDNLALLAHVLHWNYSIAALQLILPLGLSFHTFQSLSYVIEVYRGTYPAERHLGIYALYVLFFPQLVAGPIERPQHLLEELKHLQQIDFDRNKVFTGLRLMAWGFFKKLVIADRLGISVDYVYAHAGSVPGLSILIVMIFFVFQLYADFSGYTDIARGSARVLGIDLMSNFNNPFLSTSIAEFWRRWHISLSTWFRDYFFTPLAYMQRPTTRTWLYVSVLLTFLVTGLWHGAGWTFVVMGALFGGYIVLGMLTKPWRDAFVRYIGLESFPYVRRTLQQCQTFVLVSFADIFFRAPNMTVAMQFIRELFTGWHLSRATLIHNYFLSPFPTLGISHPDLLFSVGGIFFLLYVESITAKQSIELLLDRQSLYIRVFAYTCLILTIFVFGVFTSKQFIYFQF